ncbi:hypothetical protein L1887_48003 [Cichorium endivia]|nr:hypothetical protein L1887_48003 [Cichorium endivia]
MRSMPKARGWRLARRGATRGWAAHGTGVRCRRKARRVSSAVTLLLLLRPCIDVCRWMDAAAVERERESPSMDVVERGASRNASVRGGQQLSRKPDTNASPRAEPRDVEQPSLFLFESRVQHLPRSFRPFSAAWEAAQHEAAAPGRRSGHSFDFSSLAV